MAWTSNSKSAPSTANLNRQGNDWLPVFHLVKDGIGALKMLPILAIALAILTMVANHQRPTVVSAMAAACEDCLNK